MDENRFNQILDHFIEFIPMLCNDTNSLFNIKDWKQIYTNDKEFAYKPFGNILRLHIQQQKPKPKYPTENIAYVDDVPIQASDVNDIFDDRNLDCEDGLSIIGEMDIILHPTFLIPSPYFRLWNQNGSYLSIQHIQALIDRHNQHLTCVTQQFSTNHDHDDVDDVDVDDGITNTDLNDFILPQDQDISHHAVFPFGRLIQDQHPYLSHVCSTIHVCEVSNYINTLLKTHDNIDDEAVDHMYLLLWFTLIGQHIGLTVSHHQYKACLLKIRGR